MPAKTPFALSDEPISNSQEDRLNRQAFAQNLARVICRLDREKSTVLALTGQWGSGKTSIKNLLVKELESAENQPRVLEFSPWQVSGTGNISALFFEAILAEVSKEITTPQESKDKIRKYASCLSRGSIGMGGLSTVLSVAGALGVPFASVAGNLAHQAADKMKEASEASKAIAPDEPVDLKQLKVEIGAELKALTQQILVVIDDIDRLPAVEICEIIQLINVNANFPNLHYLLLFDRQTVERSLQSVSAGKGREFLEKIIQVSYHVPALTRSELAEEFLQYLNDWIEGTPFEKEFNDEELTTLFDTALCRYLGNVRHVKRLISSLSFYAVQFISEESSEVNPVDLLALEALRQFEPDVYEALPRYKEFLTEGGFADFIKKDEALEERKDALEKLSKLASEDRKKLVQELVTLIFPPISRIRDQPHDLWLKARRVCHSAIFDRYFSYRLGDRDISQSDLDQFVMLAGTREFVRRFFEEHKKKGLLRAVLHQILLRAEEIQDEKAETVVRALIDFGDNLSWTDKQLHFQTELSNAISLFTEMMRNLISKGRHASAFEHAKTLFETTDGLYLPISFCVGLQQHLTRQIGISHLGIQREQATALSQLVAAKLERCAYERGLPDAPPFATFISFWLNSGDHLRLREWLIAYVDDPRHLFRFLRAVARQRDFAREVGSENPYAFRLEDLEAFMPVETIKSKLASPIARSLDKDEKYLIEAFDWELEDANRRSTEATAAKGEDLTT